MPRHFFLRDASNFPVACIASAILTHGQQTDGPLEPDSTIGFAVSIHNPADTFNRARGREIALARLAAGKVRECLPQPNVKKNILSAIAASVTYPSRVREAARFRHETLAAERVMRTSQRVEVILDDREDDVTDTTHLYEDEPESRTEAMPDDDEQVFTTTGLDHSVGHSEAIVEASADPHPEPDGLTGTALEALMAEHPPEAEVPWTWANSTKESA